MISEELLSKILRVNISKVELIDEQEGYCSRLPQ